MVQIPGGVELVFLLLLLVLVLAGIAVVIGGLALLVAFLTGAWIFSDSDDGG